MALVSHEEVTGGGSAEVLQAYSKQCLLKRESFSSLTEVDLGSSKHKIVSSFGAIMIAELVKIVS